jgi:protease YdgD
LLVDMTIFPHLTPRRPDRPPRIIATLALLAALAALSACGGARVPPPSAPAAAPPPPAAAAEPEAAPPVPLDGRLVVNAWEYPWSAIGRLNTGGRGFCTGALVGERLVLTQAACLYNAPAGRWWHASEMHFQAGYQRDHSLADSPVAGFTPAPGFNPRAGATLANLTNNWALVELRAPIGRQVGWLGPLRRDPATKAALAGGRAIEIRAGYRRDWAHAISVHFGCPPGRTRSASGAAATCTVLPGERALPAFVLTEGALGVLIEHGVGGGGPTGALGRLIEAAARGGPNGGGRPPLGDAAAPLPYGTIDRLLFQLRYLRSSPEIFDPVARGEAIRAYQARNGRAVSGEASLPLLRELFLEVRRQGA